MSRRTVALTIAAGAAAVLAADAYWYLDGVEGNSITQLTKKAPAVVPFGVGFICGHLFA